YKLELVHVIIRHGDRTPMHRIGNSPNPPVPCKFDQQLIDQDEIVKHYLKHLTQNSKHHHPGSDFAFWETYPNDATCDSSKLTPTGAYQHLINGRNLYYKYAVKWKLFGSNVSNIDYQIRSTEVSRTFQSALAFMYGFLQNFNFSNLLVKKSPINFCSEKLSGHKCNCPGKMKYLQKSEKYAANLNVNRGPQKDIRKHLGEIYNLPPSQVPYLTQVMDVLMGQACHKIPLKCGRKNGKCVDKSTVDIIWSLIEEEGIKGRMKNKDYLKYAHLTFHPLLTEIMLRMSNVTKQKPTPKFVIYSGHDVTLTPLLATLGIYDGKWPPYASRLNIEMYGGMENGKSHHFIRVVYNGVDVTKKLNFCKTFVDGMCRFKHFQLFVKNHLKILGFKSYNSACHGIQSSKFNKKLVL
ncbi:hypothetical protein FSP39_025249, partial [Pinctada imbricata]